MNEKNLYQHPDPFRLESGEFIQDLKLTYHCFGKQNENQSNVVWVFHAISANSNVMEWWPGLFGEDCLYDPKKYFIICVNTIGSPYGSSKPQDLSFPDFTVRDVVAAFQVLAKKLEINKIHTLIGGSFGGNQALEFAYSFEGHIEHLILLASSAKESAWAIAIHESQRIAMRSDASFGEPEGGMAGMKAARSMAMLSYRTSDTFDATQTDDEDKISNFRASSYIDYQGDKFAKRFDALSYFYLTKCLDTHNIGRGRGGQVIALGEIKIPSLIIGIKSDRLTPIKLQKFMSSNLPDVTYREMESPYGHDGFLTEVKKISSYIKKFYKDQNGSFTNLNRTILKFGGSSLDRKEDLLNVKNIIENESAKGPIAIVLSARGKSTDQLIELFNLAKANKDFSQQLVNFFNEQKVAGFSIDFSHEKTELQSVLAAISLLREDNEYAYNSVVSYGELISTKVMCALLQNSSVNAVFKDARELIFTKGQGSVKEVDLEKSKNASISYFKNLTAEAVPVITGFIASDENARTVTLGRNGSNYSASLIASFINAKEVQNWTDVDAIYSSNPKRVLNAVPIKKMSFKEANDMANFGSHVLHPKTIHPLIRSGVSLRIKSTNAPDALGTLIDKNGSTKGIKAVTSIEDVALVIIEGKGLSKKVGIDARIFTALSTENVSVRMVAQASSEKGIGFVIDKSDAKRTELLLNKEFRLELERDEISSIRINEEIAIIAILGRHNYSLEMAIRSLRKNKVWMHLISNSISGEHISLVVDNKHLDKAIRVVHNEVFGVIKTINLIALGKGNVGGTLLDQIIATPKEIVEERKLLIKVCGVADSKRFICRNEGLQKNWREELKVGKSYQNLDELVSAVEKAGLENVVFADNTSASSIAGRYIDLVHKNFDLVASNKQANAGDLSFYLKLRKTLQRKEKYFHYETNVGAGLPILDTLRNLRQSSDKVIKILGVFSGSLSFIFNSFSEEDVCFSDVLEQAKDCLLYTSPSPRDATLSRMPSSA